MPWPRTRSTTCSSRRGGASQNVDQLCACPWPAWCSTGVMLPLSVCVVPTPARPPPHPHHRSPGTSGWQQRLPPPPPPSLAQGAYSTRRRTWWGASQRVQSSRDKHVQRSSICPRQRRTVCGCGLLDPQKGRAWPAPDLLLKRSWMGHHNSSRSSSRNSICSAAAVSGSC